jgi:AcrR family transcriptional regulator
VTTRDKLLDSAAALLATEGLAGVSARSIAAHAEVNQALVFYHFGTVSELLEAAVRRSVDLAVAAYRDRLVDVSSVAQLLSLGRELHRTERSRGNVAQMAQVMAGAQRDEALARAGKYAMQQWSGEVEAVLRRLLPGTPLEDVVDPRGLARAVSAGFIGLQLYDGVDARGAGTALAALDELGALVAMLEDLGPVTTRAVRSRARKAAAHRRDGGAAPRAT